MQRWPRAGRRARDTRRSSRSPRSPSDDRLRTSGGASAFFANEVRALRALGHDVRVESGRHADRLNPEAAPGIPVTFLSDDAVAARLRALAWLALRHPLRCARDLAARR